MVLLKILAKFCYVTDFVLISLKSGACIHITNFEQYKKECSSALAGVAQCVVCWTLKQRVADLIPSQGTCLGCGPGQ